MPIPVPFTLTPLNGVLLDIHHFIPKCFLLKINSGRDNYPAHAIRDPTILFIELCSNSIVPASKNEHNDYNRDLKQTEKAAKYLFPVLLAP